MKRRVFAFSLMPLALGVHAQHAEYPSRPLRIIVPFTAGSGADAAARVYGELLAKQLGQPVTVENRPGANGVIGLQVLKQAPPDGYTLAVGSSSMTVNPLYIKNLPYTPEDFRAVTGLGMAAAAYVVGASSPYRTLPDLINAAKREKRNIQAGTYTATYQLGTAWLSQLTGIDVTHVPYKGASQIVTDLIGGHLEVFFGDPSAMWPLLRDGKLRMLATAGATRLPDFPGVATVKEAFPEFELYAWISLIVRIDTPDAIVSRLSAALTQAKLSPQAQEYHAKSGLTMSQATAETMSKFADDGFKRYKQIAERAGIKPE